MGNGCDILSFDVSSVSTGWSYFRSGELYDFGLITRGEIQNFSVPQRLFIFKKEINILFTKYSPSVVLIEDTYLRNVQTLKTLMQFIGVLQEKCYEALSIEPHFLHPMVVRSEFKVKNKQEVFEFIRNRYKPVFDAHVFIDSNDITDSVLQALYYYEHILGMDTK